MKRNRPAVAGLAVAALMLAAIAGLLIGRERQHAATTFGELLRAAGASSRTGLQRSSTPAGQSMPATAVTELPDRPMASAPPAGEDDTRTSVEPAVEGFAKQFTNTQGGQRPWVTRLQPYVTEEVRQALATVDVASVPRGRYVDYQIVQYGETRLAARVDYKAGWSMVLYLVTDGTSWRVEKYDRFVE